MIIAAYPDTGKSAFTRQMEGAVDLPITRYKRVLMKRLRSRSGPWTCRAACEAPPVGLVPHDCGLKAAI